MDEEKSGEIAGSRDESAQIRPHTKGWFTEWVQKNESFFRAVEMALLVLAIGLSVLNTCTSTNFNTAVESHLTSLDTLFANVENRIEELPKSISRFDSTVDKMTMSVDKSQQELVSTIEGLRTGVDEFSEGVVSYEAKLKEIVQASDKQLELLKKTQAQWQYEISRSPDLMLRTFQRERIDSLTVKVLPEVLNKGNQFAEGVWLLLKVPKGFGFNSKGWTVYDSLAEEQAWSYFIDDPIGYSAKKEVAPVYKNPKMEFTIRMLQSNPIVIGLKYTIYHHKDSQNSILTIFPPEYKD